MVIKFRLPLSDKNILNTVVNIPNKNRGRTFFNVRPRITKHRQQQGSHDSSPLMRINRSKVQNFVDGIGL